MAATRTYYRDSKGRYAGSRGGGRAEVGRSGGFANAAHRSRVSAGRSLGRGPNPAGSRLKRSTAPPRTTAASRFTHRPLSSSTKKKLIIGGAVLGAGVGAKIAVGKVLPSQTFSKSGKSVPGLQTVVNASALSKGTHITRVDHGGLSYITQSVQTGRGARRKIETTTLVGRGQNTIGLMHSERSAFTRTNIVKSSYLTPANRKKGIGGAALTAHAAHDPNRRHRASITRSVQGQAFARAQGRAGLRSSSSKSAGSKLTREMNSQWAVNKTDYNALHRQLKASTGSKSTVISRRDVNAVRKAGGRRLVGAVK